LTEQDLIFQVNGVTMNKSVQLVEGGGTFHLEDISKIDGRPLSG